MAASRVGAAARAVAALLAGALLAGCPPSGPAAPNGGPRAVGPGIAATSVFIGNRDDVPPGFGLYSYLVITTDRQLPEDRIIAALCAVADLNEVRFATVSAAERPAIHVLTVPATRPLDPGAPVSALRASYDFADASSIYRQLRVTRTNARLPLEGIFLIASSHGPLKRDEFRWFLDPNTIVVRLDTMRPDLLLRWLADVQVQVRQGTDWRRPTTQQRLIAVAQALDLVAEFSDEVLQFLLPARAQAATPLPATCAK